MVVQCCVCKKTKMPDGSWQVISVIGEEISHGYCPPCAEEAMNALEQSGRKVK